MVLAAAVIDWLLDSGPALRWQVERDLVGAPHNVWGATRARIARTKATRHRALSLRNLDAGRQSA